MKLRLFVYIAVTAALCGCGVAAGCGIQVAFTNLTTMMVTGAQWYIQGAAHDDGEDNHQLLYTIHGQHNPGATFPYGKP
jgi:hypothetical protein